MAIYLIVVLYTLVLGLILKPSLKSQNRKKYLILVWGVIILISSLRSFKVGRDLESHYYDSYLKISQIPMSKAINIIGYENGYIIFNKIISNLFSNPQWFIAINSIIVFGITAVFIYRNSENIVMSTFLFITYNTWFMDLTMLRQSLAIAICLVAVQIFNGKKNEIIRYILFILLICLARTFHSSAIIMLIYIILEKIPLKKISFILVVLTTIISSALSSQIFQIASSVLSTSRNYADFYSNSESALNFTSIYSVLVCVAVLLLSYFYIINNKKADANNCSNKYITDSHLIYLIVILLLCKVMRIRINIMGRIAEYFVPFLWILLPRVVNRISNKNNKIFIEFMIYLLFSTAFILIGYANANSLYGTVPYIFFWEI